jgi:hypothetical protein
VIAVDLLPPPGAKQREPENIVEISLTSLYAMVRASQVAAHEAADCVITPDVVDMSLTDLTAFQELIAAGRAATEAALPQLRADLGLQPPPPEP